jgi:hypothetical protein
MTPNRRYVIGAFCTLCAASLSASCNRRFPRNLELTDNDSPK